MKKVKKGEKKDTVWLETVICCRLFMPDQSDTSWYLHHLPTGSDGSSVLPECDSHEYICERLEHLQY